MRTNKGLTLMEIIVSMAILSIILVTVITVFSSAYIWINRSGDRTEKLFLAQNELEANIEARKGTEMGEIAIPLGEKIKGGFIKSDNLITFLSKIPAIKVTDVLNGSISQTSHLYGQSPNRLTIKVETYNIPNGSSIVCKLLNQDGTELSSPISRTSILTNTTTTPKNEVEGKIDIELNLPTIYTQQIKEGIYKISINAIDPAKPSELLLGKPYERNYVVNSISAIAVGDAGQILTSSDGKTWYKINHSSSNLKSVIYEGGINEKKYVAVGNGSIEYSTDGLNWTSASISPSVSNLSINKIIFTDAESKTFLAVGSNGTNGILLTSSNGIDWKSVAISTTPNFTDATWNPVSETLIVTGEGNYSLGLLKQDASNNWNYGEVTDINFNNFIHTVADPLEDSVVLARINTQGKPELARYYKNNGGNYVFTIDNKKDEINSIKDIIYMAGTFIMVDNDGKFYKRTVNNNIYTWELASEISQLYLSSIKINYRSGVLTAAVDNTIYNYLDEDNDGTFAWTEAQINGAPMYQINSITGK